MSPRPRPAPAWDLVTESFSEAVFLWARWEDAMHSPRHTLDDVVYYVGHLMRPDPNAAEPAPPGEFRARLGVTAPGFPLWADRRTPLFRITAATRETERDFAATVSFGGERYSAGAPVDRFCYEEGNIDACRTDEYLDMSGAVLELLVGILAFNQDEDAIAPPQNSVLDIR